MNEQDLAQYLEKHWYDNVTIEYKNNGERILRFFREGKEIHYFHYTYEEDKK